MPLPNVTNNPQNVTFELKKSKNILFVTLKIQKCILYLHHKTFTNQSSTIQACISIMKRVFAFFALSILALASTLRAQRSTLFTSEGDLPCSLINCIEQCHSGFVWIATENGLCRFDGYRFHTYQSNPADSTSLLDNYVHTVHCDSQGTLRIGTLKGLMEYVPSADAFAEVPMYDGDKRVTPHISKIIELSDGDLLIATAVYGVFRLPHGGQSAYAEDDINQALSDKYVSCLLEDKKHALWIGTENDGVLCNLAKAQQPFQISGIPGNKISALLQSSDNSIYVGMLDGGVTVYEPSIHRFETVAGSENLSVKTLSEINGNVYVGTEGHGAKLIKHNRIEDIPTESPLHGVANGKVHQMIEDRNGNIWIGLFQKGVAMVPKPKYPFLSYGARHEKAIIGDGCVMALAIDPKQNIWVSCENEGVYLFDSNGKQLLHCPTPSTILSIYPDADGNCWLGSYTSGLLSLNPDGKLLRIPGISDQKISCITHDRHGALYLGTLNRGLMHYDPKSETVEYCKLEAIPEEAIGESDWINSINSIINLADSSLMIAHYNGISIVPLSAKGQLGQYHSIISGCIGYKLMVGHDGTIWCGTTRGLYAYHPATGKIDHFSMSDGLPSNVICAMIEDGKHNLWISTYHGLSRFSPDERKFVNFDVGDGIQGNEFTHGVACSDSMGRLFFGGVNGFTTFHPYDIQVPERGTKPMITQFDVFGTPINSTSLSGNRQIVKTEIWNAENVELASDDNTFSIAFTTMTFDNPHKIAYEYRILEHSKDWTLTQPGESRCTFNSFPPGTYHFQVREAGADASDAIRSLTITVRPPWYQSWWMVVIYILAALALLWLAWRQLHERQLRRNEELRLRHAEDIMEARLQFFTNIAHEIRTPLTLIINPVEKLMKKGSDNPDHATYSLIHRNACRLLRLVNQLMDMRKLEKGQMKMHFASTDLVKYITDVNQNFDYIAQQKHIHFSFNHEMPELTGWIDAANFDKILINVLSNSFKYTNDGGSVTVTLTSGTDDKTTGPLHHYIQILVSNTGDPIDPDKIEKIFDRFYRIENELTANAMGTGIGLHLCRQLIIKHYGEIFARNHADGPGCEFVVRIPQGNSHLTSEELAATAATKAPTPEHEEIAEIESSELEPTKTKAKTRFNIAIAEDDPEIRTYLHNELSAVYRITTYSNGKDLFDAMLAKAPDLVISDVMMPELDGYELCRKVRKNVNINHTPIILLSAKQDPDDRRAGLEAGADSYIVKPFDTDVLLSNVASLLANRQLLKAKYSGAQEQADNVTPIELKSHDEVLFNKIMKVINDNLASPDLSVEQLADEVGLSRVHLHRKLKEYTNLSARTFIRNLRLRQAARLLREKKLSIAEVAYATGFSTPARFTSAFKEMYGTTPTQYAQEPGN